MGSNAKARLSWITGTGTASVACEQPQAVFAVEAERVGAVQGSMVTSARGKKAPLRLRGKNPRRAFGSEKGSGDAAFRLSRSVTGTSTRPDALERVR